MREILFKAKRIDNGEWVYGNYAFCDVYTKHQHYIFQNKPLEYAIDETTICQYTGLTDKNGNKIWENDICDRNEKFPEVVKYREGDYTLDYSYAFGKEEGYSYCSLGFYVCERNCVKVIGNIFDNPELLQ